MNFQRPLDHFLMITSVFDPPHKGTDYAVAEGTPIKAIADGVVEKCGWDGTGYGNRIIIRHGELYRSLYAHMSELGIKSGREVVAGQVIGRVGSTGNSTGPHLHLEIWQQGKYFDPEKLFGEIPVPTPDNPDPTIVVPEETYSGFDVSGKAVITVTDWLNIRDVPSKQGREIGKLYNGDYRKFQSLTISEGGLWMKWADGTWSAAYYPNEGWLAKAV